MNIVLQSIQNQRRQWLAMLASIAMAVITATASAAPDAEALLKQADRARGGGLPGIVWTVAAESREGGRDLETQVLEVKATADASLAETQEPARFRGNKLLQVGRNMWVTKPGLSKPIPVSPRQRMTGLASNGDIAATNYAGDYNGVLQGEEAVNGEACYLLDLTAQDKSSTYDHVRYWIAKDRGVGVKAEFYSLSGKLLKTATFEYKQTITYEGKSIPFVSHMIITDALQDASTDLKYGDVVVQPIPTSEFAQGQL